MKYEFREVNAFGVTMCSCGIIQTKAIREWKKKKGFMCLLPDDAGDKELADF
jgi:hypothetical protein